MSYYDTMRNYALHYDTMLGLYITIMNIEVPNTVGCTLDCAAHRYAALEGSNFAHKLILLLQGCLANKDRLMDRRGGHTLSFKMRRTNRFFFVVFFDLNKRSGVLLKYVVHSIQWPPLLCG